jgi:excisionase family DNA binding protein
MSDKRMYRVKEAAEVVSMSRASLYRLIKGGVIDTVRVGSMTFITSGELDRFVDSLTPRGATA